MIEVERLKKSFGSHVALRGLTFRVETGSVVGLLGRNGAGKSTCLRILSGVLRPTAGRVNIGGHDPSTEPERARASVGYLPESAPLYPELRVAEYLSFRAELKGLGPRQRMSRIDEVLRQVHAHDIRRVRCGELSRGYQKRVSLADALLTDPQVLLLDEPTAGLDPSQNRETRELIASLGKTRTVIVSTHILAEVEAMCRDAIVIDEGQVVAQGALHELLEGRDNCELVLVVRGERESLDCLLRETTPQAQLVELEPSVFRLKFSWQNPEHLETFAESFASSLTHAGLRLREMRRQSRSLERVWAKLVEGRSVDEDAP